MEDMQTPATLRGLARCLGLEMTSVQYRFNHVGDGIKIVSPNLFTPSFPHSIRGQKE
jgi:hypothetical protein